MFLILLLACDVTDNPGATVVIGDTAGHDTADTADSPNNDNDNDGYSERDGDCDDEQPAINPMATDLVGDGIDQNCDGADGFDSDGDRHADETSGGDDCDDEDSFTFPGAIEIWYDGIDQGCLGNQWTGDSDQDGDGYDWDGVNDDIYHYGGDCTDTDADINPTVAEDNTNGVDDNCDGTVDGFTVSFLWTPSEDNDATVLTVGVTDGGEGGFAPTMYLLGIDRDTACAVEDWKLVLEGTYLRGEMGGGTNLSDIYTTMTYGFVSGGGWELPSTGTTCVVWGPKAEALGACIASDCVDITGRDGLVNDNGSWTWNGL